MHLNLTFEIPPDAPSVEKSAGRLTVSRAWGVVGVDSRWVGDEDQILTFDVYNGI